MDHSIFYIDIHQWSILDKWKNANIIPIFEKGDCTETCSNCRVSLTFLLVVNFWNTLYSGIFLTLKSITSYVKSNTIFKLANHVKLNYHDSKQLCQLSK